MIDLHIHAETVSELHDTLRGILNNVEAVIPAVAEEAAIPPPPAVAEEAAIPPPPSVAPPSVAEEAAIPPPPSVAPPANGNDASGLPWDARIHAKTKTKNADGTWKILRRNAVQFPTDDQWKAYIAQCKAEAVIPAAPATPPAAPATPPATASEVDFPALIMLITTNTDKINIEQVTEICQIHGVDSLPLVSTNRPDLIPVIYADIEEVINS